MNFKRRVLKLHSFKCVHNFKWLHRFHVAFFSFAVPDWLAGLETFQVPKTMSFSWWQQNFLVYFTPEHIPDYDFFALSSGWSFQANVTDIFTSCVGHVNSFLTFVTGVNEIAVALCDWVGPITIQVLWTWEKYLTQRRIELIFIGYPTHKLTTDTLCVRKEGKAVTPQFSPLEMMRAASFIMVLFFIERILIVSVLRAWLKG